VAVPGVRAAVRPFPAEWVMPAAPGFGAAGIRAAVLCPARWGSPIFWGECALARFLAGWVWRRAGAGRAGEGGCFSRPWAGCRDGAPRG
jgi:hypothetical protein